MADKPLKMDWNQRQPENEAAVQPLELEEEEVVTTPPVPHSALEIESSSWPIERILSNNQLEEKIPRLVKLLESDLRTICAIKGRSYRRTSRRVRKRLNGINSPEMRRNALDRLINVLGMGYRSRRISLRGSLSSTRRNSAWVLDPRLELPERFLLYRKNYLSRRYNQKFGS